MSGFQTRIEQAKARERLLIGEMEARGWTVWQWEPIPDDARDHLVHRRMELPLRWWPDIFAIKGDDATLIDAKGILAPNAAIEANAAWTYEDIARSLCPVLVFWQTPTGDWIGCNAAHLGEWTEHDPLPGTSKGSGTPWYRIPAEWMRPIDLVLDLLTGDAVIDMSDYSSESGFPR